MNPGATDNKPAEAGCSGRAKLLLSRREWLGGSLALPEGSAGASPSQPRSRGLLSVGPAFMPGRRSRHGGALDDEGGALALVGLDLDGLVELARLVELDLQ